MIKWIIRLITIALLVGLCTSTFNYREKVIELSIANQSCDTTVAVIQPYTYHYVVLPQLKQRNGQFMGEKMQPETNDNTKRDTSYFVSTSSNAFGREYRKIEKEEFEKDFKRYFQK